MTTCLGKPCGQRIPELMSLGTHIAQEHESEIGDSSTGLDDVVWPVFEINSDDSSRLAAGAAR